MTTIKRIGLLLGIWSALGLSGCGQTVRGPMDTRGIRVERELPFAAEAVWNQIFLDYGGAAKFNPRVVSSGYLGDATTAAVGAARYMYYDANGDQGIHERIELLDPVAKRMRFKIFEAKDLPIDTRVSFGESQVVALDANRSVFRLTFHYRTLPDFLGLFANSGIRSDLENMTVGMEHYLSTGETVTAENFPAIAAKYR